MPKNEKCVASDTVLCEWLNKECRDCYIASLKDQDDVADALNNFKVTLSLLPENLDELQAKDCCFCVDEKQERVCYAIVDLAHSEPESKRGMFFGLGKKVRQRIGSLMPLSISICKKCRGNFRKFDSIKWISIIAFLAIALGISFIPAVNQNPILPYGLFLVGAVAGYIVGILLTQVFIRAKSKETRFNVFDIPVCAQMRDDGWFLVQDNNAVTHLMFSRKTMMGKVEGLCEKAGQAGE